MVPAPATLTGGRVGLHRFMVHKRIDQLLEYFSSSVSSFPR
jgi:hypothetical protein